MITRCLRLVVKFLYNNELIDIIVIDSRGHHKSVGLLEYVRKITVEMTRLLDLLVYSYDCVTEWMLTKCINLGYSDGVLLYQYLSLYTCIIATLSKLDYWGGN